MSAITPSGYLRELHRVTTECRITTGSGEEITLDDAVDWVIGQLQEIKATGSKVMLVGNGGSAAIVSHVQNDLSKTLDMAAMVFDNQPLLTALANDDGYACVFERQVQLWAQPADLLIAVSSSGCSESILAPARTARARGCSLVTFTGFGANNPLRQMGDINFYVPSPEYGYVEIAHSALCHCITDLARKSESFYFGGLGD